MASDKIDNLDRIVLKALDFFAAEQPPRFKFKGAASLFVVGSVNAFHTGRLLFSGRPAIFADEGDFREKLEIYRPLIRKGALKEAVVISASGEKDSVWEIKAAKAAGLKTLLLTCQAKSAGAKAADRVWAGAKIPEPYSYNFSTYLGMVLAGGGENPRAIRGFLRRLPAPNDFARYNFFTFILPDRFRPVADMLNVKDDELFGPHSSLRAYGEGQARHAKFIAASPRELVISFGKNEYFGAPGNRWAIRLPAKAGPALVISLAYYLAGRIQASKPPYFKRGLENYCLKTGPKPYGRQKPFPVIVR